MQETAIGAGGGGLIVLVIGGIVVVFFMLIFAVARRYKKVGPNQVMIISGRKHKVRHADGTEESIGYRVRRGGGAFIVPLFEKVDFLSLEVITLDIVTPEAYTKPGVPLIVEGVAQVKIKGDETSIRTAAEQFLGKSSEDIKHVALQTVEGHLRAIVGTMTVEDIYKNRDQFSSSVQEVAVGDMANMGLQIVSFTLRDIRDQHGYLEALGKPRTAEVKRDAAIAQAEADRDANIRSANARQEGEVAKFLAETKIAEANRDYLIRKAEFDAQSNSRQAEADLAYDLQKYKMNQSLKREEMQVAVVEKEQQIVVQEREIQRREKELQAQVMKQADAERYRIQTEADATRYRIEAEARGQADASRAKGNAQAEIIRATGTAEAEVIAMKGSSEAEAMRKKADAWKEYDEAAVAQMFVSALPEIAKAIAEPLSKVDKISIVSTDGRGGVSQFTSDVANVMAQLPEVVKTLSGLDLKALMAKISSQSKDQP